MVKSIQDQAWEVQQRVLNEREELRREQEADPTAWRPRRAERAMIWVQPTKDFKRVITESGSFITEPTEVYADNSWIRRRIRDGELELVGSQQPQQPQPPPPPPPPPPPAPEEQPPPPPPTEPAPEPAPQQ